MVLLYYVEVTFHVECALKLYCHLTSNDWTMQWRTSFLIFEIFPFINFPFSLCFGCHGDDTVL